MPVEEFESAPILQRCLAKYPPVKIQIFPVNSNPRRPFYPHFLVVVTLLFFLLARPGGVRAEAMLQLFNVNWDELVQKMPEIAEAGGKDQAQIDAALKAAPGLVGELLG